MNFMALLLEAAALTCPYQLEVDWVDQKARICVDDRCWGDVLCETKGPYYFDTFQKVWIEGDLGEGFDPNTGCVIVPE